MDAVISDVPQTENQRVDGLPLKVQSPVLGIRQFVAGIVASEVERAATLFANRVAIRSLICDQLCRVRDQRLDGRQV